MNDYSKRVYHIEKYNSLWANDFQREKQVVESILGESALEILHVGSTSVPGLSGKKSIDVLVLINDISTVDAYNAQFEKLGYQALGDFIKKGGRLFAKEENGERLSHIHVFETTNSHAHEMIALRDFLISNPIEMKAYSDLKEDLYEKYPHDYGSYRTHKDEYVLELIKKIPHI